jgi:tetratricopeptide (TPR) repeat protein
MKKIIFIVFILNSYIFGGLFDFIDNKSIYQSYKNGEYADAIRELLKKDETPVVNYNLANCYYKLKDYKNALKYYKKALGREVDEYDRLYNIGNCYMALKKYKDAVTAYLVASKLKKMDKDTAYNINIALNKIKHKDVDKKSKKQDRKNTKEKHKKHSKQKSKKLTVKELKELKKALEKEKLKNDMKKELESIEKGKIPVIMYKIKESGK